MNRNTYKAGIHQNTLIGYSPEQSMYPFSLFQLSTIGLAWWTRKLLQDCAAIVGIEPRKKLLAVLHVRSLILRTHIATRASAHQHAREGSGTMPETSSYSSGWELVSKPHNMHRHRSTGDQIPIKITITRNIVLRIKNAISGATSRNLGLKKMSSFQITRCNYQTLIWTGIFQRNHAIGIRKRIKTTKRNPSTPPT